MGPYSGFTSLAWRTGTQTVAASTGFDTNGDLKTWLLDLRHDSAVQLRLPKARYVAGWDPGGDVLILSTGWQILANGGPYEIIAAKIGAGGSISTTVLTQKAVTFPVVGFVRTA